jgi:hypothetical protein
MKNKFFLLFLIGILFVSFAVPNASAFYTKSHLEWVIDGFDEVSSPITNECRPYLDIFLDGNTGGDVPVLHYPAFNREESKITSYVFTHIIGAYTACLQEAGSDVEQRCFCHGGYTHVIADQFSHNVGGLVEINLRKYFGNNYFAHMTIEKNFENKHMKYLAEQNKYAMTSGKLEYYNSIALNSLFTTDSSGNLVPSKYLNLMKSMSGIDLSQDAMIFRSGYQGEGFYNTVYKDKIGMPWWVQLLAFGLFFIGVAMTFFVIYLGKNNWKWISAIIWVLIALAGLLLISSILFNLPPTWKLITLIIEIPPMLKGWMFALFFGVCALFSLLAKGKIKWVLVTTFIVIAVLSWYFVGNNGYFSVSDVEVAYYDNLVRQATNEFLRTGNPNVIDASGLSYCVKYNSAGTCIENISGSLTKAETPFRIVFYFIFLPLNILIQLFLLYKALSPSRRKDGSN